MCKQSYSREEKGERQTGSRDGETIRWTHDRQKKRRDAFSRVVECVLLFPFVSAQAAMFWSFVLSVETKAIEYQSKYGKSEREISLQMSCLLPFVQLWKQREACSQQKSSDPKKGMSQYVWGKATSVGPEL